MAPCVSASKIEIARLSRRRATRSQNIATSTIFFRVISVFCLVVSTSGRLNADFIRLVYLHATKETKNYLDAIDPVDEEAGHEADAAGGRRDRDFLVQRSRFLAALKTRLGLILAKAVAMRVMINATGCPAPVLDRNRMNTHKHLSQLIESAIDHDIPTPV